MKIYNGDGICSGDNHATENDVLLRFERDVLRAILGTVRISHDEHRVRMNDEIKKEMNGKKAHGWGTYGERKKEIK